jgi:hypothetical protein
MSAGVGHEAVLTVCQSELLLTKQLLAVSNLENLTMRSLKLTGAAMLAAVLLTGCGAESGPTAETTPGLTAESHTAEHSSTTYTFEDYVDNPCNGETVYLTTVGVQQTNVVDGGGGVLHYELQAVEDITGTGLTTGASYRSHNVIEEGFNEPTVTALNVTYTFRDESYVMMSTTSGVSFRAGALFHFVGLPSGEFKVTRDLESLECRG